MESEMEKTTHSNKIHEYVATLVITQESSCILTDCYKHFKIKLTFKRSSSFSD